MTEFLLQCLTALLYAGLSLSWRQHRERAARLHLAALLPIGLHAWLLHASLIQANGLSLTLANALSAMIWLSVLIFWLGNFRHEYDGMQWIVYPVAAITQFLPLALPARHLLNQSTPLLEAHLLISMLAYGLLMLATLHALLMATADTRLRRGSNNALLASLPPILTMERLLFRMIGTGFALLTLALASGMLFSEQIFGRALAFNHKTVFAFASWLIFGGLLAGRWLYGWRGRTAVRLTVAGFVSLLLAWFGTQFVLIYILHRT